MKLNKFTLALLFLTLATFNSTAQFKNMNRYDPPDGINMGRITGIAQDAKGYMWFAGTGLYQYDGYHLKYYVHDPANSNSLGSNILESICIDKNGTIWVGTTGFGLERFDPAIGIFTHYLHDPHDVKSICHNKVTVLTEDSDGFLWIGTHGGLDCLDTKTKKITHYRHNPNDANSLSCNQVRSIYEDKQGTLWIGTGSPFFNDDSGPDEGGLNRFDKKTGKFTVFLHNPKDPRSLINNKVCGMLEDSHGTFWVGTAGDGLHTMNRSNGTFERHLYDPAHPDKLSRPPLPSPASFDHIRFITEDAAGGIWIGTVLGGMNYYNTATKKVTRFTGAKSPSGSDKIGFWSAFTSHEGVLWMSCWNGDLYYKDPVQKDIPHTDIGSFVNAFLEQDSNTFWLGTDQGLIRTNRSTGVSKHFLNDKLSISTGNNYSYAIYKDHEDVLWVGKFHGLNRFNKKTDDFIIFKHDKKDTNSIAEAPVYDIFEDKKGSIWLASGAGLEKLDRKKNVFTHYVKNPEDTNALSMQWTTAVLRDVSGKLWVGTQRGGGINLLNEQTGQFKHYLKGGTIFSLFEDSDGVLWACTDGGLYRYDKLKDAFFFFADPQKNIKMEILSIISIVEDNNKNLWLKSTLGILKLNAARNYISVYGSSYGIGLLNGTYLRKNSIYKGLNGKLYFGDATGYYSFFPDSIATNYKPPQIVLSDFRLGEQSVAYDDAKDIVLNYKQNNFSFDFAGIHYTNPENNKHLFMLENYQNTWRESGTEHTAYFYNVPPGHYIFKVKAASSNSVWAEKSIAITITPPWWLTWWAYTLYGLLLGLVGYALHRTQKQKTIRIERERIREHELAQSKEIEKAYKLLKATQAQLIQSEKLASLGELTAGIAHEIQNPLNFVNNFAKLSVDLAKDINSEIHQPKIDKDYVEELLTSFTSNQEKISHHGNRAATIVKGMIEHSKPNTGVRELTDINKLCDEYSRLSFNSLKAKNTDLKVELITHFDETLSKIEIVPQDIGRVIVNLVNNAFYAVSEHKNLLGFKNLTGLNSIYEPTVTITTQKTDNAIEIRIKDNGTGMSEGVRAKIFQPFFTTKPTGSGTGLGLSLAYDIVTKGHGGTLSVESTEGEGSEFIISLPT